MNAFQITTTNTNVHISSFLSSFLTAFVPVNAFQEEAFREMGLAHRDAMYLTMLTLCEVSVYRGVNVV